MDIVLVALIGADAVVPAALEWNADQSRNRIGQFLGEVLIVGGKSEAGERHHRSYREHYHLDHREHHYVLLRSPPLKD